MSERFMSAFGIVVMLLICWACSNNRKLIPWRVIIMGMLLQLALGIFILNTQIGQTIFGAVGAFVTQLLDFSTEGARFLFGNLVSDQSIGAIFAFKVLPTIIFVSSLMAVLYYFKIMQGVVWVMAKIMTWLMDVSGAESLSIAANVFVGQTEAPLVIRPYIEKMTNSELMVLMTGGFATIAGGVMAAYISFGIDPVHLLTASLMSAPAALVAAKLIIPETEQSLTAGTVKIHVETPDVNSIDAAARGASEGLQLVLNVGAMLLAFLALVYLANWILGSVGGLVGYPNLSLQFIFGYLFSPLAWLMGIEWKECVQAGTLIGEKTILNEFVAYLHLKDQMATLSPRTVTILTYALCGFANFGSIGIQLGGIGAIAPSRRHDLARLAIRALIGGTIASFLTANIAGVLIP
ncbi:MAG TPA: NupC/NupG family nucleoside CNT transporter [Bdellovibrionota bacterium]|nr:NupC/NupG family nucleoside CNT transporter [Bdellovibrionota bacterium]